MDNITVKYSEINFDIAAQQLWNFPMELMQDEKFDLIFFKKENKYSLNLELYFTFFNPVKNESSKMDVKVPVEFEWENNFEGRSLYPAYFTGYMAARTRISQKFINSNIGIQPDQFKHAPLQTIEAKLTNAIKQMQINIL